MCALGRFSRRDTLITIFNYYVGGETDAKLISHTYNIIRPILYSKLIYSEVSQFTTTTTKKINLKHSITLYYVDGICRDNDLRVLMWLKGVDIGPVILIERFNRGVFAHKHSTPCSRITSWSRARDGHVHTTWTVTIIIEPLSPLTANLFNLIFYPLEVLSRWRDPQLQVSENYSDLTKWRSFLCKFCWLMSYFIFNIFKMWYLMC